MGFLCHSRRAKRERDPFFTDRFSGFPFDAAHRGNDS